MNVGQYRDLLADLELKKAEVLQVHDQFAFGYAKTVLNNALTKLQAEIDELLNLELRPVSVVVNLTVFPLSVFLGVGEEQQVTVTAKMSDGSLKDVTKAKYAYAFFKDYDAIFNNIGSINMVDVSSYAFTENNKYRVVKTSTGWNVYDELGMDGLTVVSTGNPNEYKIVDIDGNDIGVVFETDGLETKGDNWNIDVTVEATGTTYTSSDESVFSVDENGKVYAIGVGTATLMIENNGITIEVPVTVA